MDTYEGQGRSLEGTGVERGGGFTRTPRAGQWSGEGEKKIIFGHAADARWILEAMRRQNISVYRGKGWRNGGILESLI